MYEFGQKIKRLLTAEDGPTAVEYAVMLMLIFMACIIVIQSIGVSVGDSFNASSDSIEAAIDNTSS